MTIINCDRHWDMLSTSGPVCDFAVRLLNYDRHWDMHSTSGPVWDFAVKIIDHQCSPLLLQLIGVTGNIRLFQLSLRIS